MFIARLA